MSSTYPIIGIQDGLGPDGARPLRYEINKFVNKDINPYAVDQLNLFLLALEKIQAMDCSERLSWFQIGGIHGQPYVEWDDSKKASDPEDGQFRGYCTHASILFPTWHRLYVLLIEQAIHECMKTILAEFPKNKQGTLKPAVDHWRLPYWDWALVSPDTEELVVPDLMRSLIVTVTRPDGNRDTIQNPLYRYALPTTPQKTVSGLTYLPYSQAPYTVRHPAPYVYNQPLQSQATWADGISNNDAVQECLNQATRDFVYGILTMFMMLRSYPPFSNTGWRGDGNPGHYASLEGHHNNIHIIIGGLAYGHMSVVDVAGFDPAFWLHHGNVERQLSIFQALNPADYKKWPNDKWLKETKQPWFDGISEFGATGTYTRPPSNETTTTPLAPFHKDTRDTVYDSDDCRYLNQFGYAFEELQDWLPKYHRSDGTFNTPVYCKDIRSALMREYGWSIPFLDDARAISAGARPKVASSRPGLAPPTRQRNYKEYVVNVRVDRFENRGETFVVYLFLGEVPLDIGSWETFSKLGMVTVFGGTQYTTGNCENCETQASNEETRTVTGQIIITHALKRVFESKRSVFGVALPSLEKADVGKFLKKALHWRIAKVGSSELPVNEVTSLKVSVAVVNATLPIEEGEFVRYGDFEVFDEPTVGRPGGHDSRRDRI